MADIFQVKAIKPAKLRIDQVRFELLNALRAEGKTDEKLLNRTTRNFRGRKPKFETLIGLTGNDATVFVGPTGNTKAVENWTRLDEGTKPHIIRIRKAPWLVYRLGYNSGTRPGTLNTRRSYYVGRHWRKKKAVRHPGMTARGWSPLVLKMRRRPFQRRMTGALNRGLEKGGWK